MAVHTDVMLATNDYIELCDGVDPSRDPLLLLEVADLAAQRDMAIGRVTLARLSAEVPAMPEPWSAEARNLFAGIFLAGAACAWAAT